MKDVKLCSKTFTFGQDNDSCDMEDMGQYLKVETQDAGGGNYIVISTRRWAIDKDDLQEFVKLLESVLEGMDND